MKIKQQMVIGHNLRASDLSFADKIGGLVCPSMAIFRNDHEFRNYGEITLLMDKSKINLRTHPAHNSDIYSMRFPPCYYSVDTKVLDSFSETVSSAVPEMEKYSSSADYHEKSITSKGFDSVADEYMKDTKVLMAYARDIGLNPRLYREKYQTGISFIDTMDKPRSFVRKLQAMGIEGMSESSAEYAEMSQLMFDAMTSSMRKLAESKGGTPEEVEKDTQYFIDRIGSSYFKEVEGKPMLFLNPHRKIVDHIHRMRREPNPIDEYKTKDRLRKLISTESQRQKFKNWLEDHIAPAFHSPYMHVVTRGGNQKKLAFTAENALKAMKGKANGEERTMFMGAGSVRSLVAKRFTSYRDMQSHIGELVSEKDMDTIKDELNSKLADFPEKLAPFYQYDVNSWRYRDAVYEEIAEYARTKRVSELQSFVDIDPDVMQELDDYLAELRNAKTHYFEIKKQSIVSIEDFDAAVVPKGIDKAALEILKKSNLKITFYDPEQALSRIKAVNQNQDLMFGNGEVVTLQAPENESLEYK